MLWAGPARVVRAFCELASSSPFWSDYSPRVVSVGVGLWDEIEQGSPGVVRNRFGREQHTERTERSFAVRCTLDASSCDCPRSEKSELEAPRVGGGQKA
jgi:hypothetical protein